MEVVQYFLLAALTVAATGLFTRKHTFVNQTLDWFGAQAYCRSKYVDLSTIDTPEEVKRFKDQTADSGSNYVGWIGLNKKPEEKNFTLWSDGTSVNYVHWKTGQPDKPDSEHCGLLTGAGIHDYGCKVKTYLFCYTWEQKLFVVQEEKTWDEALKHCRTFYTDIISLNSTTDLDFFNNVTSGIQTHAFWTGLHFHDGSWYWLNKDALGSLFSPPSCPVQPFVCGALTTEDNVLENRDCKEKKPFVCYVYLGS